ncbi:unnamed protein product, partial [marine sediment metagenome]
AKKEKWNFHDKFEVIKEAGFISPESFKNLNKSRNLLEHDYILPDKKEVEFGIDLVELYIEHTDKILEDTIEYSEKLKKKLDNSLKEGLPKLRREKLKIKKKVSKQIKLDLSDYPTMFIKDGKLDFVIVVGDKAPAEDVVSAIDIATSLQHDKKLLKILGKKDSEKVEIGTAVLASEVDDVSKHNIISIGNPCDNPVTAEILGVPHEYPQCLAGFEEGVGMIKLYSTGKGKIAIVVAGLNPLDTKRAARVLANYEDYA